MLRDIVGRLVTGLGLVVFWVGGFWGLFATFGWLEDRIGVLFSIIAVIVLPITLPITALVAGLTEANWSIAVITFGSAAIAMVTSIVGAALRGSDQL